MTIKTISAKEFIDRSKNQALVMVDVRTPAEHRTDALTSIIHLPLDQFSSEKLMETICDNPGLNQGVYFICQSGKRAQIAAVKCQQKDSPDLFVVEGGMKAIRDAQGIAPSSKQKMSLDRQVRLTAGALILTGVLVGYSITPLGFILSGIVGAGLMYSAITDSCGMGYLLMKAPWNQ